MKIMIVCGGTGGHIYPGIAVARAIRDGNQSAKIIFVGRKKSLEEQIFLKEGWTYKTIITSGMPREFSISWISFVFKMLYGIIQAILIVSIEKPDIIVGTGAYVTVPVILAGKIFSIPELIMEQNTYPGLATRMLGKIVDRIAITFEETAKYLPVKKCIHTGNPVRPEIINKTRNEAYKNLNLDPDKKTILIFGGSQGAQRINQACIEIKDYIESLHDKVQLIMVTGENEFKKISECYERTKIKVRIVPFIYNMEDALAISDLVISRAGASTLAELTVKGIPAILVPYPYATDNHQLKNAQSLVAAGAAYIILDKELTGEKLMSSVNELLFNVDKLDSMHLASQKFGKPDALKDIVGNIEELVRN